MGTTQEIISKLKRSIFVKRGVGEPYQEEEAMLKGLEEEERVRMKAQQARAVEAAKKEKELSASKKRYEQLKVKVVEAVKQWQEAALELFREERTRDEIFQVYRRLDKEANPLTDFRCYKDPARSFWLASTRTRWIEDDIDTLTESFRSTLLQDNVKYFTEKGGKKKRERRAPVPKEPPTSIEYAIDLINRGQPLPEHVRVVYEGWLNEHRAKMNMPPVRVPPGIVGVPS